MRATITAILLTALAAVHAVGQVRYDDFRVIDGITLGGTAQQVDSVVRLTYAPPLSSPRYTEGTMWYANRVFLGDGFATQFQFRITSPSGGVDANGITGGDGIAFVIQTTDQLHLSGGAGGQIGYDSIPAYLAIEFDTFDNPEFADPSSNHVAAIERVAGTPFSLGYNDSLPDISDGRIHTATIVSEDDLLQVFLDDCTFPVLSVVVDLDVALPLRNGYAWVGITSATGSAWETHEILNWRFDGFGIATPIDAHHGLCPGDSLQLIAPGAYASKRWSTGENSDTILVDAPGVYSLTAAVDVGCFTQTRTWTTTIAAFAPPSPTVSPSGRITLCDGDSIDLDAGDGYAAYRWTSGDTGRYSRVGAAGDYAVMVVDSNGCTGGSLPLHVSIRPSLTPAIEPHGPLSFCDGMSVTLRAEAGYSAYLWSTGATADSIVVSTSGNYFVRVTDASGCEGNSDSVEVVAFPRPQPTITPSAPPAICAGSTITLTADPGYVAYRWSTGDTTPSIEVGVDGDYSVSTVDSNGCSGESDAVRVRVRPTPKPQIDPPGESFVCSGDSITLRAPAGFRHYIWSTGDTSEVIRVGDAGTYSVTVVDSSGCTGTSSAVSVGVHVAPRIRIVASPSSPVCEGESVRLSASGDGTSYQWSTGDRSPAIDVHESGRYTVLATDSNGCAAVDSIDVVVYPLPDLSMSSDTTICRGTSATVSARSSSVVHWSPDASLSCSDCDSPTASPASSRTYYARATGAGGCTRLDSVRVRVVDAPAVATISVDTTYRVAPGRSAVLPVRLRDSLDAFSLDTVQVSVAFDGGILVLKDDPALMQAGTLLEGWTAGGISRGPGSFAATYVAPTGTVLSDTGVLLRLPFTAYIGSVVDSPVRVVIAPKDLGCTTLRFEPGRIRLDSICGLNFRLIEPTASKYALAVPAPNPVRERATIGFSVGLDGPTRLVLYDATGHEAGRLVDRYLTAGEYSVEFNGSGMASGSYLLRLTQGTVTREVSVTLLQ